MIRLRDLLDEKVTGVKWLRKAHKLTYDYMIPITPTIGNILYKGNRIKAFHITSPNKLGQLNALRGTKKSISCMTRVPQNSFRNDAIIGVWNSGIMFYLEGELLLQSSADLASVPDEQGRRWVWLPNPYNTQWVNIVDKDDVLNKIRMDIVSWSIKNRAKIDPEILKKYGENTENYLISKRIFRYIELAEKFVKEKGDEITQKFLQKKIIAWDELLLNNIELIDVIWDNTNGDRRQILSQLKSMVSGEVVAPISYKDEDGRKFVNSRKVK